MFSIRSHHKQAIIRLINCITNCIPSEATVESIESMTATNININSDSELFRRLAQIISVHESVLNSNEFQFTDGLDRNQLIPSIQSWISSFYCSPLFINQLFDGIIDRNFDNQNDNSFHSNEDNYMNIESKLWTITLLILNIIYKMRNCFIDLKMMLELGWICLSELDSSLHSLKPNYNHILSVLQKALNHEKCDNKVEIERCDQLSQEVKQMRNRILDLQKKLIKVNKEKAVLTKNDNCSQFYGMSTHRLTTNANKRNTTFANSGIDEDEDQRLEDAEDDSDSEHQTDSTSTPKRIKSNVNVYNCDICNKMFATSYKLNRHMYSHTGLRPYSCLWPACHKQFNDNYHLKRHMLTHTGEKPYICHSIGCTKRFARPEDLRHHQKSHIQQSPQQSQPSPPMSPINVSNDN